MSLNKVRKAIELLKEFEEIEEVYSIGSLDIERIREAETFLNLVFPLDYVEFLKIFGAISFGSSEIYGITNSDFESGGVPNSIAYTFQSRSELSLDSNILLIGNFELGCPSMILNNTHEATPVVAYHLGFPASAQTHEILAPSFGDYFYDLVVKELEYLND